MSHPNVIPARDWLALTLVEQHAATMAGYVPGIAGADGDDDAGDRSSSGSGGRDDDAGRDRDRSRGRDDDRNGDRDRDRTADRDRDRDDDRDRNRGRGRDRDDDDDRSDAGFARMRRERDEARREVEERDRKAREAEGKFEELYNESKGSAERLEGRVGELELDLEAVYVAIAEGARNPRRVVRLMRADGLLDDASKEDVERAVKRFKRSDADLFGRAATRQTRRRGRDDDDDDRGRDRDDDDDDDDDDRDSGRSSSNGKSKGKDDDLVGPARLRAAMSSSTQDRRDKRGSRRN